MAHSVVVIGPSGKTGCFVIKSLLGNGHKVRAVSRSQPKELPQDMADMCQYIRGDVRSDDPAPWMSNMDAVVFAAAGNAATENAVDHLGAARCATAAKAAGIARFVLVSAHGAHDPTCWGVEFKSYLEAKAAGERAVCAAFPASIVLRPGILTDEPRTGRATIRTTTGPGERPVTRADLATVVSFCATRADKRAITLEIVGGDQPIHDVLKQTLEAAN